jgi:hypothetical protein
MSRVFPNFTGKRSIAGEYYYFKEGVEVEVPKFVEEVLVESKALQNTLPSTTFWITKSFLFEILPGQVLFKGKDVPDSICRNCEKRIKTIKTKLGNIYVNWCLECGRVISIRSQGELQVEYYEWLDKAKKFLQGDMTYLKDCTGTRKQLKWDYFKKRWAI